MTFNCGASPVTITVTSTEDHRGDTSIDGGGLITISGGGATRRLLVNSGRTADSRQPHCQPTAQRLRRRRRRHLTTRGTLTVTNSTFSGNSAGGSGGAIYNAGTLTVTNSTFSGNSAPAARRRHGGAIFNDGGTLTVTNSTFSGNSAMRATAATAAPSTTTAAR